MARKIMQELSELISNQIKEDEIDDTLVQKKNRERQVREYFNEQIYAYLRSTHKSIGELDMEDFEKMTRRYNTKQKQVFQEQLIRAMKTNRGKPISRIKEHNKSVLLNQLLD